MNIETEVAEKITQSTLAKLGFTAAATRLAKIKERGRKMMIAYEHYRFVRDEKIREFKEKLYHKTKSSTGSYETLDFTPIADFQNIPPARALKSLEAAILHNCFDAFEIAHIVKVEDPILFGRIDGCTDRFFIDQWDEDVKIEDILKDNEG